MNKSLINYLGGLVNSGEIQVIRNSVLIEYQVTNLHDPSFTGSIFLTRDGEAAYCKLGKYFNRRYSRGEELDINDIEAFVNTIKNDTPEFSRSIFGKAKLTFKPSGIKFTT